MMDLSGQFVMDSLQKQMTILAEEKAKVVGQYLNNYFGVVLTMRELEAMMLGFKSYSESPIVADAPI